MVVAQCGQPSSTDAQQLEDRRLPTTTLEGWRRFVAADPCPIELLDDERRAALSQAQRRDYDEARIAHHAELVVMTSTISQICEEEVVGRSCRFSEGLTASVDAPAPRVGEDEDLRAGDRVG